MKQFIFVCAFFALIFLLTPAGLAANLTVTKTADTNDGLCDADCSLREAIAAAASEDTIVFSELFNSAQTITLGETYLLINKNLKIIGGSPQLITISGNNLTRVFTITSGSNVELSGLTITNGTAYPFNGQFKGGGIHNDGNLAVNNCVIKNNNASLDGAGIYNSGGTLDVTNSTINRNFLRDGSGGGIYSASGWIAVTNSSVSENGSNVGAGGIKGGSLTVITNSSINNNTGRSAGGFLGGRLKLVNSTVSENLSEVAGGIYCAEVNIVNSTISGNKASAGGGGGIMVDGSLTVTSSTITNNFAPPGNSGAGGIFRNSGSVTIRNSIVAANVNNVNVPDIGGVSTGFYTSSGYNLIGNVGTINGFNQTGDQTGTSALPLDPMLDALGNYGGPTKTHRLRGGSPAIDRGSAFDLLIDQRGFTRTYDFSDIPNAPLAGFFDKSRNSEAVFTLVGDGTDIGAYERALAGISGRVLTASGRAVQNARVVLSDSSGGSRTALTGNFGYYRFNEVLVGETHTITVISKSSQFTPQVLIVNNEINNVNLIGQKNLF